MKKFNEFEAYLIVEGLKLHCEKLEQEIQDVIDSGKTPIYAKGYFTIMTKELIEKIADMTKTNDNLK